MIHGVFTLTFHQPLNNNTNELTPYCRILFEKLMVTQPARRFPAIMKPEGSVSRSQNPEMELYPKPL